MAMLPAPLPALDPNRPFRATVDSPSPTELRRGALTTVVVIQDGRVVAPHGTDAAQHSLAMCRAVPVRRSTVRDRLASPALLVGVAGAVLIFTSAVIAAPVTAQPWLWAALGSTALACVLMLTAPGTRR